MPPNRNAHGGKGHKKGKKVGADRTVLFESRTDGQDYGRVLRVLGDRRVMVYGNDGVERVCKIRGALCRGPKKQIITAGDVVLFSLRSFDDGSDSEIESKPGGLRTKSGDVGDIILKYDSSHWRLLRKEEGINPNLFSSGDSENQKEGPAIFASEQVEGVVDEQETPPIANNGDDDIDIDEI